MKIVFTVLGVILLILLLVVLLILFYPISYTVEGEMEQDKVVKGKIRWLFSAIGILLNYENGVFNGGYYILWKKTEFDNHPKEQEVEEDVSEAETKDMPDFHDMATGEEQKNTKQHSSVKKGRKKINFTEIRNKIIRIKQILTDKRNHKAVKHIFKELLYLIQTIVPKKSVMDVRFSTGSPDTTGQAYGVMTALPLFYHNKWKIYPDFTAEQVYLAGTFYFKGWICVAQIVGILFRIIMDKNFRNLYAQIQQLKKQKNQKA